MRLDKIRFVIFALAVIVAGIIILVVWSHAFPQAREVIGEYSWTELKKVGKLQVGEIEVGSAPGPREQLKIKSPVDQRTNEVTPRRRKMVTVIELQNPPVTKSCYVFEGSIRCKDIKGPSSIRMGCSFPDGKEYGGPAILFGEIDANRHAGPVPFVQSTSDWKPFKLLGFGGEMLGKMSKVLPSRIALDIEFAGPGTVYLSPVTLRQYDAASFEKLFRRGPPRQAPTPWWTDRDAGLIGGIGGSIVGLLGGLIGTLGGFGKARRFVLTLTVGLVGIGVVSLIVGLIALALGQPYAVYYPLLLFGTLLPAVCGGILPALRRGYEQRELRKMAAMDSR